MTNYVQYFFMWSFTIHICFLVNKISHPYFVAFSFIFLLYFDNFVPWKQYMIIRYMICIHLLS